MQRQLGVSYKTAYRMGQLIRKHMAAIDGDEPIGGKGEIVEIDEAYVGGEAPGSPGRGSRNKTIVVGVVERGGGDALVKVVPNTKLKTLTDFVVDNVEPGSEIHADMHVGYNDLKNRGYEVKRINKKALGSYVTDKGVTVNAVENFWRHLKRSIAGTHISVSPEKLEDYAKEFEYRFNRRTTPEVMLGELLSRFPELDA